MLDASPRRLLGLVVLVAALTPPAARGAVPAFAQHTIDAQNTFSAAAAIDVDGDGRLDIMTGGAWYAAPDWQRHAIRDVEFIRGRFDDYACLPLDVDGDGRLDFLTANYRSEKLAWIQQPAGGQGTWPEHLVEKPGPMETGRLADVDGDGHLDILPNGRDFAAWWSIERPRGGPPRFVRHDLPPEVVGHGVGFGDINGDGRGDLVGPGGWLEAPADRRQGRWLWHAEFRLDRDASVPIQVVDVDGDGDADLVWGRGHATGVYWLEQGREAANHRVWTRHAIDTSWSQPHTVELADLDNDGVPEVVAGKRHLGHDGKDLGEWDPKVIYAYAFDRARRCWQRGAISPLGGPAGLDLDPKLVDLDGDGDCDLLAPGRSGLYWFENLHIDRAGTKAPPPQAALPSYPDHAKLMVWREASGAERAVTTPADWALRRAHILAHLQSVMGDLPAPSQRVPLEVKVSDETTTENYVRRKLTYAASPGDRVPAWLFVPRGLKKPAPAMLCLHQTTRIGKDEPAGLGGQPTLHYAHELAQRGYVCLVPDYPSFGEYPYDFQQPGALPSGSMRAVWNNIRGVDLLETLAEVDTDKIGVIGHSLGGHNAIFTAVMDLRLRAVVTSCGFTAFHDYYGGKLAGWTSDRYMPRIRDVYNNDPDRVPFDFHELVAAIAPRAFFTCSPEHDGNFDVGGVRKVMAAAAEVYRLLDARDRLVAVYPDSRHDFPDAVRQASYEWLPGALAKQK